MQTKDNRYDAIISGAGPAGATLALLLANAGLRIALLDAEAGTIDPARPSGRTAALLNGSINLLKAAGVWDRVADIATPLRTMRIVDDGGPDHRETSVEFHASEIGASQFGYNVPNNPLRAALLDRIGAHGNIDHLRPQRLRGYTADPACVTAHTEDGMTLRAPVIVGTDGRGSAVRKCAGIEADSRDYGQVAMTCMIEHDRPHDHTSTEFHRPGGPFTFVPMPGNRSSVVWVERTDDAARFLAMKKQDYQQALQDRSRGLLGRITLGSSPESWPLMTLNAKAIVAPRAALAAEAAHVLSPIGAQGLNLSLRDVASLAETIVDAARVGEDIGSAGVLSRYAARRRADISSHVIGIDHYNRAIANDSRAVGDLRRAGWTGLTAVDPLRRFLMRHGLAPTIDDGRLLAGNPL